MTFLSIHGIELPVFHEEWKRKPQRIGDGRRRSNGGRLRDTRVATKDLWTGQTPIVSKADADAFIGLLLGDGHAFSFEVDPFSAKGLIWSANAPTVVTTQSKYGFASGQIASGLSSVVDAGYAGLDVTVLFWRRPGSGVFDHYVMQRAAGGPLVEYRNGVLGTYSTLWGALSPSGVLTLQGKDNTGANAAIQIDDLVILPYLLTPAMIATLAMATTPWGDLPILKVSGDGVGSPTIEFDVMGNVTGVDGVQAVTDGVWRDDNVTIDFTLEEV